MPKLFLKSDSITVIENPIRIAKNKLRECVINIPIFNRFSILLLTKFKIKRTWKQKEIINATRIKMVNSRGETNRNMPRKKLIISKNDKIKTPNGFEAPTDIQSYDYDGQMYNLESDNVNLCVTPNHRMYVKLNNEYEIKRADEIYGKKLSDYVSSVFEKFEKISNTVINMV